MKYTFNPYLGKKILPVDIVLAPEWWYKNEGITFDKDFFFNPLRRVEVEQQMEEALYKRWGRYGLGMHRNEIRPEVGAVHLAAGFLLSEMLGCEVIYSENHPPQVVCKNIENLRISINDAFNSNVFKYFVSLVDSLKQKFGYVTGDVNWGGILNLAMDIRGNEVLTDMLLNPDEVKSFFKDIATLIEKFTAFVFKETKTTSISVNRNVMHLDKPVFLHSECTHTMISEEDYENFLLYFDIEWSKKYRPFGIHHCGPDPHRMVYCYTKIPYLDFLDVGWGGDVKLLRKFLPNTFLNIRLSPVELARMSNLEISETIINLAKDSENPYLTGICCINIDDTVSDDKITTIFQTVETLRKEYDFLNN